ERGIQVLMWNYHDDDLAAPDVPVDLTVSGLPAALKMALREHLRVDATHSNAFSAWKAMGSPQSPTGSQYKELEASGRLQLLTSPEWIPIERGTVRLRFDLPRQGLSLVRIEW